MLMEVCNCLALISTHSTSENGALGWRKCFLVLNNRFHLLHYLSAMEMSQMFAMDHQIQGEFDVH